MQPHPTLAPAKPCIEDDDLREPTKAEIMDDIRQGLGDVLAGDEGMPAREGLEALRRRIYGDAECEPT